MLAAKDRVGAQVVSIPSVRYIPEHETGRTGPDDSDIVAFWSWFQPA